MSEDTQKPAVEEAVKEPQVSQDAKKEEQAVPYYRFNEVLKERNQLKGKLDSFSTEQEEQRKKSLEEQGEYKTLLSEEQNKNKDLQKKFDLVNESFGSYVQEERNNLLKQIPENKREKFEKVDDLSLLRNIAEEFNQKLEAYNQRLAAAKGEEADSINPLTAFGGKAVYQKMWRLKMLLLLLLILLKLLLKLLLLKLLTVV